MGYLLLQQLQHQLVLALRLVLLAVGLAIVVSELAVAVVVALLVVDQLLMLTQVVSRVGRNVVQERVVRERMRAVVMVLLVLAVVLVVVVVILSDSVDRVYYHPPSPLHQLQVQQQRLLLA